MSTYGIEITSIANPRVKIWLALADKKGRDKHKLFLVEGPHLVMDVLRNIALRPDCIVYDQAKGIPSDVSELAAMRTDIEWIAVSTEIMRKCTDTVQPQGIFAVLPKLQHDLSVLLEQEQSLVVVADGVQDPGNLGTIIRSADAVGATGVILGRGCVDLYNSKTVRSTMGSILHLPIVEADLLTVLPQAQERGVRLVSAALDAVNHCYHMDFRSSTWFIMGNEAKGVSQEVEQHVTHRVLIPMKGKAESLNVAMASTILLYEALRQREYR